MSDVEKPRRGRPPQRGEAATVRIGFKLTPTEYAAVRDVANLTPVAALARAALLDYCGLPGPLSAPTKAF